MQRRTFIHHDGALGDVLLSLPAIAAIRAGATPIHLAARPDVALLLRQTGCVDEVSPVDSSLYLSLYTAHLDRQVKEFLSGFERVVIFTTREDSALVRNSRRVVPDTKTILAIPPENVRMPVAEFRLRQLAAEHRSTHSEPLPQEERVCHWTPPVMKGIGEGGHPPFLDIQEAYREGAREVLARCGCDFTRPLIALHPGSGGRRKCWPFENYRDLAGRMVEQYDPFLIFLSGPAEENGLDRLLGDSAKTFGNRVLHLRDGELVTVSALLSLCDLYVGNDSGITHLAASVDGQVIVLFGPTDPLLWRPIGERVKVVSADVKCAPCGDAQSRVCAERRCLLDISVERVYDVCAASLESSSASL